MPARTDASVYTYGPVDGSPVLAIHGMTGHGQRWESWAAGLPDVRVIAPDLIGHGRSSWTPPWSIEAQVEQLLKVLDAHTDRPVVVVGHSYGGAIGLHLAAAAPTRVSALVLLDPAIALDPADLLEVAESTAVNSDYTNVQEAREEKVHGAWADVDPALLDAEIDMHLVAAENDRVRWRISTAAVVGSWGELARPITLPPKDIPVTVVQATKVQPPYVSDELKTALSDHCTTVEFLEFNCDHMIPQAEPEKSAAVVRAALERLRS